MKWIDDHAVVLDEKEKAQLQSVINAACDKYAKENEFDRDTVPFEWEVNDETSINGEALVQAHWTGSYRPATYWHPEEWPEMDSYEIVEIPELNLVDDDGRNAVVYMDMDEYNEFTKKGF